MMGINSDSRKDENSQYFDVQGSGRKVYQVTINYEKGHWCTCRGMISMKSSWKEDAGRTKGTSCKHVKSTISEEFEDDWGTKNSDGSRTPNPNNNPATAVKRPTPAPPKPSGRRAAVMATRAKLALEVTQASPTGSLSDRIASLEAAR
jgi:hypothetical protein